MPKRPWNQCAYPVYSLATYDKHKVANFNLCTYVTPISLKPKLYSVAVYQGTKTLENMQNNIFANLHILSIDNLNLFNLFGKTSGKLRNKQNSLSKKGELVLDYKSAPLLDSAHSVISLKTIDFHVYGDHTLYILEVQSYKHLRGGEILTTQNLVDKGLIL